MKPASLKCKAMAEEDKVMSHPPSMKARVNRVCQVVIPLGMGYGEDGCGRGMQENSWASR